MGVPSCQIGQVFGHGHADKPREIERGQQQDIGDRVALAGREFLASESYTIADILLLTTLDFAGFVGMAMPENLTNLAAWHARVSARPSAAA